MSAGETRDAFSEALYPFLLHRAGATEADVLAQVRASTLQKCADVAALRRAVLARHADDLVRCAEAMARAFERGATLLAFGNGGSATDAQDAATDFLAPPSPGARPLPAVALANDVGTVTGVGNDVGFENVFARQLMAFGRPGDIALGISTSGTSANVVAALGWAGRNGLLTVGWAGYDGGTMAAMGLDHLFVVPSTYVPRIQEAHATIHHTLWALVHRALEGGPA